jgi:hypothetical protein
MKKIFRRGWNKTAQSRQNSRRSWKQAKKFIGKYKHTKKTSLLICPSLATTTTNAAYKPISASSNPIPHTKFPTISTATSTTVPLLTLEPNAKLSRERKRKRTEPSMGSNMQTRKSQQSQQRLATRKRNAMDTFLKNLDSCDAKKATLDQNRDIRQTSYR